MARLMIDLAQRILEVEGDEPFIREIYADFKNRVDSTEILPQPTKTKTNGHEKPETPPKADDVKRKPRPNGGGGAKESYELSKQLDLYGKDGRKALKEFYEEKAPVSAVQRNTLFVYYLKKILEHSPVTLNDIYTCYSAVRVKAPDAFRQSVKDTSGSRYGYLDAKDMENLEIPLRGIQFVEHDLPPKAAKGGV